MKVQSLALALVLLTAAPGFAAPQKNVFQEIWARIVRSRSGEKPRSTRGGPCPITPTEKAKIWSDRPIFVWTGEVSEVKLYREDEPQKVIWSGSVKKGQTSIAYDGKPLAPGTYIWKMLGKQLPVPYYFGVMGGSEREEVNAELKKARKEVAALGTQPEGVVSRVDVFSRVDLVSDAVMELYSVSETSPEIETLRKDLVKLVCKTE